MKAKRKYYAFILPGKGRAGVADNWVECETLVKGVSGARYRSFASREAAEAWLRAGARYEARGALRHLPGSGARRARPALEAGIYFDAGTGRGRGVEVSVTDETGANLLHKVLPRALINEFGKHGLGKEATNNYGELLAMKYALELALREGVKKAFGDSKLVIDWWSRGFIREKKVAPETVKLAAQVKKLREEFLRTGGKITHIPGSRNPADLGFH